MERNIQRIVIKHPHQVTIKYSEEKLQPMF